MRRLRIAVLLLPAVPFGLGAGSCDIRPPDHEIRAGLSKEEMEAGPSYHRMKGAILNDVRKWRMLDQRLEEGRGTPPDEMELVEGQWCVQVEGEPAPLLTFTLRSDLPDVPYRVEETAYYSAETGVYFYRYVGGPKKLNVWQGPFKIDRKRVKPDEE